ncbi:prepilin peptidase [Novosphingobium flavum]|uniref:Prepilin peptidase n=1 Tax=Novosphingobium flavum TaxID=1778672 RepID=A0A7X1FTR2_9SPHN|nr:prepilin peptidase [Novosphingobium flavum]MBC2666287.1 prepilin peptidase [Novosphingobium flavum]
MNLELIAGAGLALLVLTGALLDLTTRRLPNWLCLLTAAAGLGATWLISGPAATGSALLHGLIALVIGMVLFRLAVVGGGDAKFYTGAAMWFPLASGIRLLLSVSLTGLALFIAWFVYRRLSGRKISRRSTDDADKFPYGIAIAAGAMLCWFGF